MVNYLAKHASGVPKCLTELQACDMRAMTRKQLIQYAKHKNIKKYSTYTTKAKLVTYIQSQLKKS